MIILYIKISSTAKGRLVSRPYKAVRGSSAMRNHPCSMRADRGVCPYETALAVPKSSLVGVDDPVHPPSQSHF